MTLEEKLKKLEKIADELEEGGISLDDGIKLYEQGIELTKTCLDELEQSKSKISAIREQMSKLIVLDGTEE